ncbi:hypothetical protein [Pectobacterium peruviense]|nr:hypothetical protein [Pectobacterium peruviense]
MSLQKPVATKAHSGYRIDRGEKSSTTLPTLDANRTVDSVYNEWR